MNWLNEIGGMLQKYSGATAGGVREEADRDFDQVAHRVPQETMADGIADAFRSQQTPPFPQMLSQLFGNSHPQQKATLLNTLLAAVGPGVLSGILSQQRSGLAGEPDVERTDVTPEQAEQISPEAVRQVAEEAERRDPSIIDRVSNFYAQQPDVVKTLGAAALTIALAQIGRRHKLL